jgi:NAD(P)-dependent dehydrogenase (short-subunit alcohol dehydrogenase family)
VGATEPVDGARRVRTIVVVGGEGAIGRRLVPALRANGSRVISAGRTSGDIRVDLTSHRSIEDMYRQVDGVDDVVCVGAHGALDDFGTLTVDALRDNMSAKFFGQADLVLTGQHHCRAGASFTLTSGIFADKAWPGVTGGGVISGALHSFVLSAAVELPQGMRVNAVSPTRVEDSAPSVDPRFAELPPVSMDELVQHYLSCVHGTGTGEVVRAYG